MAKEASSGSLHRDATNGGRRQECRRTEKIPRNVHEIAKTKQLQAQQCKHLGPRCEHNAKGKRRCDLKIELWPPYVNLYAKLQCQSREKARELRKTLVKSETKE